MNDEATLRRVYHITHTYRDEDGDSIKTTVAIARSQEAADGFVPDDWKCHASYPVSRSYSPDGHGISDGEVITIRMRPLH